MKKVLLALVISVPLHASKYQYSCEGLNIAKGQANETLTFNFSYDGELVFVSDPKGVEHVLLRGGDREDEDSYQHVSFSDVEVDGYGGYIRLVLPKSFLNASEKPETIAAYYTQRSKISEGKIFYARVRSLCKSENSL